MVNMSLLNTKSKTGFQSLFWWYIHERWTEIRILIKSWSRCFKRIEMQSTQKYKRLALDLSTSHSTICCHLKKISKVSKLGTWVPHTLSEKNKDDRKSMVTSLLSKQRNMITGDKKWIFYDNVQCKRQLTYKDESLLGRKVVLCVGWNHHGIIHFEFLYHNQTLNADLYFKQLQHMYENFQRKCLALIKRRNIVLLFDNASSNSARITQEKILALGWSVLPHPTIFSRPRSKGFPSFSFSTKCSEWQKILLRGSNENLCGNLVELKTSWILLGRNQQADEW